MSNTSTLASDTPTMAGLSPAAGVAIGIIVGLASTCVQSVGLTLQRKSHMEEDEKEDYLPRQPAYRRRRWQIGMLLFLIANIVGSTIQITTLPLPLLSTLQASGLVFNSLLASLLLKEPWTWRTAYGTVLVAAGAVLISYFSALPEPSHSLRELLVLLGQWRFLVWFSLSLVLVIGVLIMTWTLRFCMRTYRRESPRILLVNGMSFGLVSGVFSAHALLLAKSAVELIVRSLTDHNNQFRTYQPWLLVLAFLFLSLSQLYYLHLGLKLISTSVLYPFVFCIYNIVAILDGLIYFQQLDRLSSLHAGLVALGTVLLLSGVLALSWRLSDEGDEEQPSMIQAEIPQTVLAPGMGFVGDPGSETNESVSGATDDDDDDDDHLNVHDADEPADERTHLLRVSLPPRFSTAGPHSPSTPTSPLIGRRHRRAATLKEVRDIWEALGDFSSSTEAAVDHRPSDTLKRPRSSTAHSAHGLSDPTTAKQRHRRRSTPGKAVVRFDDASPVATDPEAPPDPDSPLLRARTMPASALGAARDRERSARGDKGRRVSAQLVPPGSGALFSQMLTREWWSRGSESRDDGDAASVRTSGERSDRDRRRSLGEAG